MERGNKNNMKKMNLYEIETLEELIAYSNDSLNIDDEASVTIKVELFAQLKEDIFYGKCKLLFIVEPSDKPTLDEEKAKKKMRRNDERKKV